MRNFIKNMLSRTEPNNITVSPCKDFWSTKIRYTHRQVNITHLSTELLQRQLINVRYNVRLTEQERRITEKKIVKELEARLFSWV